MKKVLLTIGITILIAGGLVVALLLSSNNAAQQNTGTVTTNEQQATPAPEQPAATRDGVLQAGRYEPYEPGKLSAEGYSQTILFFHAVWCPECRAFETAINGSTIPAGIQILKVDYDNSTELKQKYGVTLQSTFVSVDSNGELVSKWVGYGKDKSVDAILENI